MSASLVHFIFEINVFKYDHTDGGRGRDGSLARSNGFDDFADCGLACIVCRIEVHINIALKKRNKNRKSLKNPDVKPKHIHLQHDIAWHNPCVNEELFANMGMM